MVFLLLGSTQPGMGKTYVHLGKANKTKAAQTVFDLLEKQFDLYGGQQDVEARDKIANIGLED